MKTRNKIKSGGVRFAYLLPLCAVFLTNPTVRLVDVLPDFVACFIVAAALKDAAMRAPFFDEARRGFIKLGIVSLWKIPAFVIENTVRAGNVSDFDITVLFTFTFSVIEGILLIGIIKDLFAALFYLGERSEMSSLLSKFPIGKKNTSSMTPEKLRVFLTVAVLVRLIAGTLPEFLLLTRTTDGGSYVLNIRVFYPYAIVLAVIVSLVVGIIAARRLCAYIRAVRSEGGFVDAVCGLVDPSALPELERKLKLSELSLSLNFLLLGAASIFSLRFDNLSGVNLVPMFLMGVFWIVAVLRLERSTLGYAALISGAVYAVCAAVAQAVEFKFLNEYSIEMLAKNEKLYSEYLPTVITLGISLVPFTVMSILMGAVIYRIMKRNIYINDTSDSYSTGRLRSAASRCCLWVVLGVATAVCRFLDVYFNLYSSITIVSRDDGLGGLDFGNVTYSLVPWFGTLVFALSVLYIGYTVYLASRIKEDAELYKG